MSNLDADRLEGIHNAWAQIALDRPGQIPNGLRNINNIVRELKEMGLDMAQNETYELIADGLTRKEFLQTKTYLTMFDMLDLYHGSQKVTNQGGSTDQAIFSRLYGLERLRDYSLPEFESLYAQEGLPDGVSTMVTRQVDLILQMQKDGTLEKEIKIAANAVAIENFRHALAYKKMSDDSKEQDHYRLCREGEGYARLALEAIDKAQEYYQPGPIPFEPSNLSGWGWSAKRTQFDKHEAQALQDHFVLKVCGSEFQQAKAFQDKGHFVLDASGSGHGMMVMPMQKILSHLEENKYDIRDPQTFVKMGTDIDTFWDSYNRERQEVARNDQYKLIGSEYKR